MRRKNTSKTFLPTNATIAVTYKCNAKCIMCNIWKNTSADLLKPEDFLKLPSSLKDVNLTGGEPFLRNDIVEIARNLTKLNSGIRLIFSSNGFLTDKIVENMKEITKFNPKTAVGISIDGMKETHLRIRGIPNAFEKAIDTVKKLKEAGIKDLRIAFTAGNENIHELPEVYKLAEELGVEFTMSIVHNSENYFNIDTNLMAKTEDLEKYVNTIVNEELKYFNPRRLLRTFYLKGLIDFTKNHKRPLPCYALGNSFFLDANGELFPCNILETSVGNIKESSLEDIWYSEKTQKLRNYCHTCNKCWMVCTVKDSIMQNIEKVSTKVLADKVKTMFL
ncbi:MAG TPA: hypothetical protein DDW90_08780 [Cyanobacteria bacterium UBA9971]|nr:hypothetical protein [Cyanobacteria bacterium UBA9971]